LSQPDLRSRIGQRAEATAAILAEIQAGLSVETNFRRLIELYYAPVHKFFANRGFSPDDCLDLTQETFLGIYTSIGSFRHEAGFDTWLFKVATNVVRKRLRWRLAEKRSGQEVPLEDAVEVAQPAAGPAPEPPPAPPDAVLERERSRLLRAAVEKLPPQMRRCLMLRVYQDLKYREIAEAMHLSIETVKAHLYQARSRLQQELGDYFDGGMFDRGAET